MPLRSEGVSACSAALRKLQYWQGMICTLPKFAERFADVSGLIS
jgi:hypothetical protein